MLMSVIHAPIVTPAALITEFAWPVSRFDGLKVLDLACGSGRNGLWFCASSANRLEKRN